MYLSQLPLSSGSFCRSHSDYQLLLTTNKLSGTWQLEKKKKKKKKKTGEDYVWQRVFNDM